MKVSIKYENEDLKKHQDFVLKFIKLLQKEYPLKEDLKIIFMEGRKGGMSTGSRRDDHLIKVLAKDRLNRDIMRTLAHEWVHEYQMTILGRKHGPNIGGKNEDEANAFAGQLIKKFEERYPKLEEIMYENKGIEGRVNLLNEQILITEKRSIKETLLIEMKKIGIEELPYSYSSLQRFIDSKTMNIHYNKHYKGYVDKLNKAIKDKEGDLDLEEIIKSISKFDDKVRNNAGGAFNHALFWKMLSPKKQTPKGEILKKIKEDFGNIKKLKDEFNKAAQDRFGSGWAWLYLGKDGKLKIMSTPNQDNPLMNIIKGGGYPLLGLDVWEHAYYLKYQNKRDEYISKFWDVVNWEFVNDLFVSKTNKKKNLKEGKIITESKISDSFPFTPKEIRMLIHKQYDECINKQYKYGCLGKIQTKKCKTEIGILGGDYSELKNGGSSTWSIINRFDTNTKVREEIYKIWMEETEGKEDLRTWVIDHAYDLFSNDGMYTDRLVKPNLGTIIVGKENESYAMKIIREIYQLKPEENGITYQLYEHCSGDINDRKKGQDIVLKLNNEEPIYFQIKPFLEGDIEYYNGGERGNYFKVKSWHNQKKYKPENVDVILYVDRNTNRYIMFRNNHNRMMTVGSGIKFPPLYIYYYEMPLKSNFKLDIKPEKVTPPIKKSIERDKSKEIDFYKERIKYFQDRLKELGYNESINEKLKILQTKYQKIIND